MYNIYIRPLQEIDAATSYKWRNDPQVWQFTGSKPDKEITLEIEQEWLLKVINDQFSRRFAIIVDEVYIGNVQLTHISNGSAEFHIFIGDKNYWGKGVATLATYQLLHYAKFELNLDTVYLTVREDNLPAIRSYEKNSFVAERRENGWIKMNCLLQHLIDPTVSVFIMVYNHEQYLKSCLDGILEQKSNFTFDLVVGEDCSTDGSRQILLDYRNRYPGKFKLLLHETNVGPNKNQDLVLSNCKGKYLAICEGDDYWTDALKLQKQVDFLEKHSDYNVTVGRYKFYYEASGIFKDNREIVNIHKPLTLKDYIAFNFSHTSTFLLRLPQTIPDWFHGMFAGDQSLMIISAGDQKIKYFEDFFSVYRINQGSVTGQSKRKDPSIAYNNTNIFLTHVNQHTQFKFEKQIARRKKLNQLFFKMDSASNKIQSFYYRGLIYLYRWYMIKNT